MKLIRNIGCLAVIVIVAVIFVGVKSTTTSSTSPTATSDGLPDQVVIEQQFRTADRDYLRTKFGPKANITKAGSVRVGDHPGGKFYVHEFSGHDELDREVTLKSGLLYNPATGSWTYYPQHLLMDALKSVTVNGSAIVQ